MCSFCLTKNLSTADTEKLIRHLKRLRPETIVIVGGPQSAGLAEAFLRRTGTDALCPGEGEESLMELLDYYLRGKGALGDIRGVGFIDGDDRYISTPQPRKIRMAAHRGRPD